MFSKVTIDNLSSREWRARSIATEEILAIFEKREHLDELTPYMDEFTKLMIKLVGDLNFKTCINSLNIIGFIIKLSSED